MSGTSTKGKPAVEKPDTTGSLPERLQKGEEVREPLVEWKAKAGNRDGASWREALPVTAPSIGLLNKVGLKAPAVFRAAARERWAWPVMTGLA